MKSNYKINSFNYFLQDKKNALTHINAGDYFGTLATVLDLIEQTLKQKEISNLKLIRATLQDLEQELLFLQNNYHLNINNINHNKPKIKNKNNKPKGKLINQ